jgi:mercuric ion transport protein
MLARRCLLQAASPPRLARRPAVPFPSFGLGSAWLIAVAWLAAPHRLALLGLAIVCLGGAGGLLLWRRRSAAAVCPIGAGSARPAITAVIVGELALGVVLTVLGFLYA